MLDKIQVFELCTTQTVDFFPQIHFSVLDPCEQGFDFARL